MIAADKYGSSAWTVTAKIFTIRSDGTPKQFFLKCATEDSGRKMLEGEIHSMTELYKTMPSFVPEPYAWGKFQISNPETYFFLCQFIKMSNDMPDAVQFSSRVRSCSINLASLLTTVSGSMSRPTREGFPKS